MKEPVTRSDPEAGRGIVIRNVESDVWVVGIVLELGGAIASDAVNQSVLEYPAQLKNPRLVLSGG
jgi:hypothetical protein